MLQKQDKITYLAMYKRHICRENNSGVKVLLLSIKSSIMSYFDCRVLLVKFAYVIISIFILSSCGKPSSETGFENTQSAIQFYKSFLSEIQQIDTVSIEDLCREVCKWRTNRDSVIKFIKSEKTPHVNFLDPIREIDNDIAKEIARLIPPLCSFADVLYFKHNTIAFPRADSLDNIISSAHAFFDELDSATLKYRSCNIVIEEYIQFLNRFSIDGIHSLEQLKDFIKQEDYHFTSYLQHLTNIDNDAISTITTGTESCYMEIYNAAERGDFGMNEMLTYVTIRTNRRLLANAWSCLRHIQDGNVDNESQAFSCYWMLIQPFISIDDFGMQLLSLRDKTMLSDLSEQIADTVKNMNRKFGLPESNIENIPQLLIKVLITSIRL